MMDNITEASLSIIYNLFQLTLYIITLSIFLNYIGERCSNVESDYFRIAAMKIAFFVVSFV